MNENTLIIHTRTPLHVGSGANVGAIDNPIQRERHTGFPIIPASSLKGSFADHWNIPGKKIVEKNDQKIEVDCIIRSEEGNWLFGFEGNVDSSAGALLFQEARILLFPIRSAKASYAWITCPLMLQRAKQDGIISCELPSEPPDSEAIYSSDTLNLSGNIVLEEYCFKHTDYTNFDSLAKALQTLATDSIFTDLKSRLVILSNGMMSHFVTTCCEVAQHVRINDETGTAEDGALFNQENVPSDTLFYSIVRAIDGLGKAKDKKADDAFQKFAEIIKKQIHQFGGDATTGHGFCTITIKPK